MVDDSTELFEIPIDGEHAGREALPFKPSGFVWQNIKYTVKIGKGREAKEKVLLNDVSGLCKPGQLLALMGATGGKNHVILRAWWRCNAAMT